MRTSIIEGQKLQLVYVLSVESGYTNKTRRKETVDLWHARLTHVSYHKLNMMMNKLILRGLPQLDVRIDTVCARC